MSTDLTIAMIGFGLRASLWHYLHRPGEGSVVSMVCDTSERGRADAADRLPDAQVTANLADVIDAKVDAAVVLVPDFAHAQVSIPLLRAGIPVFCEKPLEISVAGADEILRAAYETGTKLYVGHNMRHMPVIRQMRRLIQDGAIGQVKAAPDFYGNSPF